MVNQGYPSTGPPISMGQHFTGQPSPWGNHHQPTHLHCSLSTGPPVSMGQPSTGLPVSMGQPSTGPPVCITTPCPGPPVSVEQLPTSPPVCLAPCSLAKSLGPSISIIYSIHYQYLVIHSYTTLYYIPPAHPFPSGIHYTPAHSSILLHGPTWDGPSALVHCPTSAGRLRRVSSLKGLILWRGTAALHSLQTRTDSPSLICCSIQVILPLLSISPIPIHTICDLWRSRVILGRCAATCSHSESLALPLPLFVHSHFIHVHPSSVSTRPYSFVFVPFAFLHSHLTLAQTRPLPSRTLHHVIVCCLLVRISLVLLFFHHFGTFPLIVTHVCHLMTSGSLYLLPSLTTLLYFTLPYLSSLLALRNHVRCSYLSKTCS